MVDEQKVCCMCGDVGFPDKLFRCSNCRNRFQHSYCSNYYTEHSDPIEICDWCQCEEAKKHANGVVRLSYPTKQHHHNHRRHEEGGSAAAAADKVAGKAPSPRTTTRRYKLLKDVMC